MKRKYFLYLIILIHNINEKISDLLHSKRRIKIYTIYKLEEMRIIKLEEMRIIKLEEMRIIKLEEMRIIKLEDKNYCT